MVGYSGMEGAGPTEADSLLAMLKTITGNAWFQDDHAITKTPSNQKDPEEVSYLSTTAPFLDPVKADPNWAVK